MPLNKPTVAVRTPEGAFFKRATWSGEAKREAVHQQLLLVGVVLVDSDTEVGKLFASPFGLL